MSHTPSPRVPSTICGLLVLLLAAAAAVAAPASLRAGQRTVAQSELRAFFEDIVRASRPDSAEIEIVNFAASPGTVTVPRGVLTCTVISQRRSGQGGRAIILAALEVDGRRAAQVTLTGDVRVFGTVACAARPLARHTVLGPDDIRTERRDIGTLGPGVVTDPARAVGKELRTTLRPGAVLFESLLKNPQLVKRGDMVTILARSAGLRITVPGMALGAGAMGDLIRVKNMMSRKEIYAKVLDGDTVAVEF